MWVRVCECVCVCGCVCSCIHVNVGACLCARIKAFMYACMYFAGVKTSCRAASLECAKFQLSSVGYCVVLLEHYEFAMVSEDPYLIESLHNLVTALLRARIRSAHA